MYAEGGLGVHWEVGAGQRELRVTTRAEPSVELVVLEGMLLMTRMSSKMYWC